MTVFSLFQAEMSPSARLLACLLSFMEIYSGLQWLAALYSGYKRSMVEQVSTQRTATGDEDRISLLHLETPALRRPGSRSVCSSPATCIYLPVSSSIILFPLSLLYFRLLSIGLSFVF